MEANVANRNLSPAKFMLWSYSVWIIKSTNEDTFFSALGLPEGLMLLLHSEM